MTKRTSDQKSLSTIWRTPEELWKEIGSTRAEHHPLKKTGCRRIDQLAALDRIIFRLSNGC